jgi:8-oxo-dGTP pyrophosphatase MutT (NUDIX family)
MKKAIQKAGAIIFSSVNKNKIALRYGAGHKDWSFPKGHIELGESAEVAMLREIKEETGLSVKIVKELPDLEYLNYGGENVSTKMFLVESKDDSELKPEFEGDDIKWFTYNEVIEKLTYDNLKEYFKKVLLILN